MDVRQLKHFVTVANVSNFTHAAQQLHIAQPALSISIKKFEQQLGVQLIKRDERKANLTDEGKVLYEHAVRILQQVEDARLAIDEMKGLMKGEVRLGAPSMMGSYFFPQVIMAFKKTHPHLKISVVDAGIQSVRKMLLDGELDIGVILNQDVPNSLETDPLFSSQMVATVSNNHPLAGHKQIDFRTFFSHELVMFKPGYFHREFMDNACREENIEPDIAYETNLLSMILSLVRHQHAITALLKLVTDNEPGVTGIPFHPTVNLDLALAWRKNAYLSYADRAFIEFTKQYVS
ncbi:LysR family transcriptional regulator [Vibrio sp. HA2012]|uniref:LysR family transcriptional regulator n=1 Tax=Vibrio sp. HA2012 TaxID=1971595 RepID=UPI000C2C1382|nr:LysR family transcriptional regulator [Vibrio sp. HA2012]PJC86841.1 LysR family transcriptional regulator [Vibrio sp. HA2012]